MSQFPAPPPTLSAPPSPAAVSESVSGAFFRGVAHALPICLVFWTLVVLCVHALG